MPAPDIDSESLAIEIYRPQDQTNGKVECYYVLLLKMAHTETIDDLQVEFLDGFFDKYRRAEKSLDMEKLRPYITMAVPAFNEPSKRIAFSTSESTAAPAMTSCGACVQVNNTLLQPGRYLVVVAAAVNTSHKSDAMCGHMQVNLLFSSLFIFGKENLSLAACFFTFTCDSHDFAKLRNSDFEKFIANSRKFAVECD